MSMGPALKNLSKVGLLDITQRGRRSSTRNPHHYRLTYLPAWDDNGNKIEPTDRWRKYRAKGKKARKAQNTGSENDTCSGSENDTCSGSENATTDPSGSGSENDTAIYNLAIYFDETELGDGGGDDPIYGVGHNRGPALDADDLSIPDFLRR
jgi:hypothetical protein